MIITVKYDKRDFWGMRTYAEDERRDASFDDLKKAFRALAKDPYMAVWIDNSGYYWESIDDYEKRIITHKIQWTWVKTDTFRDPFEDVKKRVYKIFRPIKK